MMQLLPPPAENVQLRKPLDSIINLIWAKMQVVKNTHEKYHFIAINDGYLLAIE